VSPELLEVLPDGFTTEVCPAAETWWREAAELLKRGRLLTFDYGLNADEFFAPHRVNGTLRAYHRHHLNADLLANPGEQDLTAHVNFTALQQAGEVAGLKTESLQTQAQFLIGIGRRAWSAENAFGPWSRKLGREFQTLTHPQHLGRAFRVLAQSRGD
jgi:SAM-dependent MidA family methyltransferase